MADSSSMGNTGNTAAGGAQGRLSAAERFRTGQNDTTAETPPSPNYVTWLHAMAPTKEATDVHHRLGDQPWDAAGGTHRHRGGDYSVPLFDDADVVSGDLSTPAGLEQAVKGILTILARLGLVDQTT